MTKLTSVERILMRRDGYTLEEARELIEECREALIGGDDYAIEDYLGLEPDYIFDVIGFGRIN